MIENPQDLDIIAKALRIAIAQPLNRRAAVDYWGTLDRVEHLRTEWHKSAERRRRRQQAEQAQKDGK